jgi:hypothetical protein
MYRKETYCMSKSATPTVLTLQEACELRRFSPSRIYYLTSTEGIPHLKFGGTYGSIEMSSCGGWSSTDRAPRRNWAPSDAETIQSALAVPLFEH